MCGRFLWAGKGHREGGTGVGLAKASSDSYAICFQSDPRVPKANCVITTGTGVPEYWYIVEDLHLSKRLWSAQFLPDGHCLPPLLFLG